MPNEILPGVNAGFVVFGAVSAIADSTDDPDRLPDVRPSKDMQIRFSPKLKRMVVPGQGTSPSILVSRKPQDAAIGDDGYMIDATETPGVWVVVGRHQVELLQEGTSPIQFEIDVTTAHTVDSPLDLAQFIQPEPGLPPLPGTPMQAFTLTQAQYDALPGYDPSTAYFVIGVA